MRPLVTSTFALAALLLATAPLAAQGSRRSQSDAEWLEDCRSREYGGNRYDAHACEVREVPVRRDVRSLTLDGASLGGISVTGWDRDSVHVSARIIGMARTQAEAERAAKEVRITADGGTIRASGRNGDDDDSRQIVSYDVYVPRHMDLDLRAHNGGLRVEGVTGRMSLETVNGGLSLDGTGGDVRARAQNGGVNVRLTGKHWEGTGLDARAQRGREHAEREQQRRAERGEQGSMHSAFHRLGPHALPLIASILPASTRSR